MNDQYNIAKERGMLGSNGTVDLSTINHRTDILPTETETVDVQPDIPQTGNLSVDTIDFSRISRSSQGAAGMQFINSDKILKQYWGDNGNLTYNVRDDGMVEIREGGEIIGFTDKEGIRNAINASNTVSKEGVSTSNKVGTGPGSTAAIEAQAQAARSDNSKAPIIENDAAQRAQASVQNPGANSAIPFAGDTQTAKAPNLADYNQNPDVKASGAASTAQTAKAPNLADYNQNPDVKASGAASTAQTAKAPNLADYNQNPDVKASGAQAATQTAQAQATVTLGTDSANRGYPSSTEGLSNSPYQQTVAKNNDLQSQYQQLSGQRDQVKARYDEINNSNTNDPMLIREGREAGQEYTRLSKEMTNIESQMKENNDAQASIVSQVANAKTQTAYTPEATGTARMAEEIAELEGSTDAADIAKKEALQQSMDSIESFYGNRDI